MNIYQATLLARLESHIDEETGEIDMDGFMAGQEALKDKQLATVAYIRNQDTEIEALDAAIKKWTERKKAMQNRRDAVKDMLVASLKESNTLKLAAPDNTFTVSLSVGSTTAVEVTDETKIPDAFKVKKETFTISKAAIKEALLAGTVIEGAYLAHNDRLTIR
jgi:hypothetical protein